MGRLPPRFRLLGNMPELGPKGYRVYDRGACRPRALKLLDPSRIRSRPFEGLKRLWKDSLEVDHPGVLRLVDTSPSHDQPSGDSAFLLYEDFRGTSLEEYPPKRRRGFEGPAPPPPEEVVGPEPEKGDWRLQVLWQTLSALGHLHVRDLGYGALEPRRIVVQETEGYPWVRFVDWVADTPERGGRAELFEKDCHAVERLMELLARRAQAEEILPAGGERFLRIVETLRRAIRRRRARSAQELFRLLRATRGFEAEPPPVAEGARWDALVPSRELLLGEIQRSLRLLAETEPRRGRLPSDPARRKALEETASLFLVEGESGTGKSFLLENAKKEVRTLGIEVRELALRKALQDYALHRRKGQGRHFYVLEEAERWSGSEWKELQEIFPTLLSGWPKAVVAISYRPKDLSVGVRSLVDSWLTRPRVRRLELRDFASQEISFLTAKALPHVDRRKDLDRTLLGISGGQPRLALGVLQEWIERGILRVPSGRSRPWSFDPSGLSEAPAQSVAAWSLRRFHELAVGKRKAVATLSALRIAAPASWIARLLPCPLERAEAILEELTVAGLVVRLSGPRARYRIALAELGEEFRKELIGTDQALRRGALLEEEYALRDRKERVEILEPLAWNYVEQGLPRKAWSWGLRTIRELRRSKAFAASLALGESLLKRVPHKSRSLRRKLASWLLEAATEAGLERLALEWHRRLRALSAGDARRQMLELCKQFAIRAILGARWQEAIRWAELGFSRAKGDPNWQSEFLHEQAWASNQMGKPKKARALALRAVEIPGQTPLQRSRALHSLAAIAIGCSEYATAASVLEERLEMLRQVPQRNRSMAELLKVYHDLGIAYRNIGEANRARELLEKGLKFSVRMGNALEPVRFAKALGDVARMQGRLQEAIELSERSRLGAQRLGDRERFRGSLMSSAATYRYLGNLPEAERLCREGLDIARQQPNPAKEAYALLELGIVLLDKGRQEEAASSLEDALRIYKDEDLDDAEGEVDCTLWLVRRQLALGKIERSGKLLGEAEEKIVERKLRGSLGDLSRARAEHELARGLVWESLGSLLEAARWYQDEPAVYEMLEAHLRRCEVLAASGQTRRARKNLQALRLQWIHMGSRILECRRMFLFGQLYGDLSSRTRVLKKALDLAVSCGSPLWEARARHRLGQELSRGEGTRERAEGELARAREIYGELGWPVPSDLE